MTAIVARLPALRDSPSLHRRLPGLAAALDVDAMRPRLRAMLDPTHAFVDGTPHTVRYRGADGCDVRFTVRSRHGSTGAVRETTVLGRVLPGPDRIVGYQARVDPLVPAAAHLLGPFAAATFTHPDLALVLSVFPVDPALPTLAAAADPARLRYELPAVFARSDCAVEVVRHARDGRCVLRYALPDTAPLYGKVHADATGAALWRLLARLGPALAGVGVPRPLGYSAAIRTFVCARVPGRPAVLTGPGEARRLVAAAAAAASALHAAPVGTPARRAFAGEATALRADLELLRAPWPEIAELLGAELTALEERAGDTPAGPPVLVHGDLTPSQLLLEQGSSHLVDFDAAAMAEPAFDLGRFRGYLRLALLKAGHPPMAPAFPDAFADAYIDAARPGRRAAAALPARMAVFERLSLLRVATNACLKLKTDRLLTALTLLGILPPPRRGVPS